MLEGLTLGIGSRLVVGAISTITRRTHRPLAEHAPPAATTIF